VNTGTVKRSPAKINLILRVLKKREDGYHELASLMQRINLFDQMRFISRGNGIVMHCPGSGLPTDEGNIAVRAAKLFFEKTGWQGGIEITLKKEIPVAAGLGGGSSNAATTLMALNEMTGAALTKDDLMEMGASLGADVPFFIFEKTAWAFGVGDRLRESEKIPGLWYVLVNPGVELSTRRVYESLKLGLTNRAIQYNIPRLQTVTRIAGELQNDLEDVSERMCPSIRIIKDRLKANGALGSLMSGSGPTVFGIFRNKTDAEKASRELKKDGFPFVCSVRAL
jgi:4-diphosphocytidyl-2-C-methyl-D-erythritol kinase